MNHAVSGVVEAPVRRLRSIDRATAITIIRHGAAFGAHHPNELSDCVFKVCLKLKIADETARLIR
ncbi:hypothetical protein D3C72_2398250 [compost metagenome]